MINNISIENSNSYCKKEVFKIGSDAYYSFLSSSNNEKNAIAASISFFRKVSSILDNNKNIDLNYIKLNWWKKEVNNIYLNKPSHPISIALNQSIKNYNIEKKLFLNIIQSVHMNINRKVFYSICDLNKYFYYSHLSLNLIILKIINSHLKESTIFVKYISFAIQLINTINNLGLDIRNKKLYLPEEYIKLYNINLDELYDLKQTENLKYLLESLSNQAKLYYYKAIKLVNEKNKKQIRPFLIMLDIKISMLNEIEKNNFKVINQKISITPIKKIFIAYRYI